MAGVNSSFNSPYYGQVNTDYIGRGFTYDGANRLTQAPLGYDYGSYWFNNGNYYSEGYSYDGSGNISTLTRNGPNGTNLSPFLLLAARLGGMNLAYGAAMIVASSAYTIPAGDNDTFEATTRISLLPGFKASPGCTFHARITSTPHGVGSGALDQLSYYYNQPGTNRVTSIWNQANNITSIYSYDNNGNLVSDAHTGIAFAIYDISNKPVSVYLTNGNVIQYAYDADGNRMEKQVGSTYNFYINGKDGAAEAVSLAPYHDNILYNVLAGSENIAQVSWTYTGGAGGSFAYYYYLKDHLGDIKMTLASNGGVVGYNDYYPFGLTMAGRSEASSADPRYQFTSKERDAESGLDYFGARYYDSWRGQWLSVDPMTEIHGDYSPYAYVYNNPISLIDPYGLDSLLAFDKDHNLVPIQQLPNGYFTFTAPRLSLPEGVPSGGVGHAGSSPSIMLQQNLGGANLPGMSFQSFSSETIKNGNNRLELTFDQFAYLQGKDLLDSWSITINGKVITVSADKTVTVGDKTFQIGKDDEGRQVIVLSHTDGGKTLTHVIYLETPQSVVNETGKMLREAYHYIDTHGSNSAARFLAPFLEALKDLAW